MAETLKAKSTVLVKPLDRLERRGLIIRNRVTSDRRLHSIEVTGTGHEMVLRGLEANKKSQVILLQDIKPADQEIFFDCLRRVIRNVDRIDD